MYCLNGLLLYFLLDELDELGELDELNSYIGLCKVKCGKFSIRVDKRKNSFPRPDRRRDRPRDPQPSHRHKTPLRLSRPRFPRGRPASHRRALD